MKEIWAISNYRVSSPEQLESGSLDRQEIVCVEAAQRLDVQIVKSWSGSVSSKAGNNVSRKDLLEMLAFCKSNKKVKFAIFDEYDRYMRSINEGPYFEVLFQQLGVKVWYASESDVFNGDDALAKFMRTMSAFKAEGSNEERQRKSIAGHTMALKAGRYGFRPKAGYRKGLEPGIHVINPTTGPILQSYLIKIAERSITLKDALKEINQTAFVSNRNKMKMDKFKKIIIDPYYAGVVEMDNQVKWRNEEGVHEALITLGQHEKILQVVSGYKKNQNGPRKNGNPKYPFSNLVACSKCVDMKYGRLVGFDHGNGSSNGIVYEKYRCRECGMYISRQKLHEEIISLTNEVMISEPRKKALLKALKIVWDKQLASLKVETTKMKNRKVNLDKQISAQAMSAIDPANALIKDEILKNIESLKAELETVKDTLSNIENKWSLDEVRFIKFALEFVDNLGKSILELDRDNLVVCKEILFPSGFWIDENKIVYTEEISPILSVAHTKKDPNGSLVALMVRVTRL